MNLQISQRWNENGKAKFMVPDNCFIPRLHEIAVIKHDEAKAFVLQNHYAGSMPSVRRSFGLLRNGKLVGVAVFSHPVNNLTLTNAFGGEAIESLELGRFCLLDSVEFNAESWFISVCRKRLKDEGFRGIVAFSDDLIRTSASGDIIFPGHIGTIYAASSAIYTGRSEKTKIRLLPDGKVLSARAISKIRNLESGHEYASAILEKFGAGKMPLEEKPRKQWLEIWLKKLTRRISHPGNHRYLFPLQKGLELPKSLDYPKLRFNENQLTLF